MELLWWADHTLSSPKGMAPVHPHRAGARHQVSALQSHSAQLSEQLSSAQLEVARLQGEASGGAAESPLAGDTLGSAAAGKLRKEAESLRAAVVSTRVRLRVERQKSGVNMGGV